MSLSEMAPKDDNGWTLNDIMHLHIQFAMLCPY